MPIIVTENLSKVYGEEAEATTAVDGISLSVEKGEFVAIMGPSGSGKSTLLQILGFLDHPTSGTYRFADRDGKTYTDDELAHIRNESMGFIFQAFNLLPRTTVLDNVILPLQYSRVSPREWTARATAALEAVGLSHRLNYQPSQLSGGEKQRVAIARALINDPAVVFADEPTGNLDSRSGTVIMEILQHLNEHDGRTIVLITHETYTAEHASRIIRILDGKIASDEPVKHRLAAGEGFLK